jgi:hypothetical protein
MMTHEEYDQTMDRLRQQRMADPRTRQIACFAGED